MRPDDLPENIRSKIAPQATPSGCWLWLGAPTRGYGRIVHNKVKWYAHRLVYEQLVAPIPASLELHHSCRVKLCVNPNHLEAVTHVENMRREAKPRKAKGAIARAVAPVLVATPFGKPLWERLGDKFTVGDGCWEWVGRTNNGYGSLNVWTPSGMKSRGAHRLLYELLVGPIPEGLELDHLCRNTLCVNPGHLDPVSHLVNMRRGGKAQRTHCPSGHPYDAANTYVSPRGWRRCRQCSRLRRRVA